MKAFIARVSAGIGAALRSIGPREAALLIGLALLAYGAGFVYWAAGFILPGIVLLYVAIIGLR